MHIFADQISRVSLAHNNLRIELNQRAANNETQEAGTLIIPASQANYFVNALVNSLKELEEKLKGHQEEPGQ